MRLRLRALPLLLLGCGALAPPQAWALPDLARGMAALERGELAAAEADLVPLAEQGYAEAQVRLARVYDAQETPDGAVKAAHWYRIAAEQDPALRLQLARSLMRTGTPGALAEARKLLDALAAEDERAALPLQLRLYRELPQLVAPQKAALLAQKLAASSLVEERAEAMSWYRANRLAHPAYEQALAAMCDKDRKAVEACYADLARHFRTVEDNAALEKLRTEVTARFEQQQVTPETLERVARYLSADDLPGKADYRTAYALMLKIEEPSPEAITRKARLLIAQPNLDPSAKPEEMLKRAHAQGSGEAAIQLGRLYLDEYSPLANPAEAKKLLSEAAQTLPSAHTWLGRLYERGYFGLPDPDAATSHYLIAARAGNSSADIALARMFWANRGIRQDPVQAYAFARLAQHAEHPGAPEFLAELVPAMTRQQVAEGLRLAQAELDARTAAAVSPDNGESAVATAEVHTP